MSLLHVQQLLRSEARKVAIEAPAGCGKTHEAVNAALDLSRLLPPSKEVLVLAHTNAAVQEFRARARGSGARVRACTLDAFALELVASYSPALDLPTPLRFGDGALDFRVLAPKLRELCQRAPTLSAVVAGHYPFVIFDEHQDSREDQQQAFEPLFASGMSRIRFFGDPMQAIYGFTEEDLVDWNDVVRSADASGRLSDPHRWRDNPQLGEWILKARQDLQDGRALKLHNSPKAVRAMWLRSLADAHPRMRGVPPALIGPLYENLRERRGTIAVLARNNAHAYGVRVAMKGRLPVYEGVELPLAYEAVRKVTSAKGRPRDMCLVLLNLLEDACTGLSASKKDLLNTSLTETHINAGKRRSIESLLGQLHPIYQTPDVPTWCACVRAILSAPPDWLTIQLPESLRVIGSLRLESNEDPESALEHMLRYRKEVNFTPKRCVTTIHKSKGREFDHVIVVHCSRRAFPDDEASRRVLYVALSRAKQTVTFLGSEQFPSPLLCG